MAGSSQEARTSLVLTTICINDESSKGSLSFVSRMLTYSRFALSFPPTLTTAALYHSSLEWFGTCS